MSKKFNVYEYDMTFVNTIYFKNNKNTTFAFFLRYKTLI